MNTVCFTHDMVFLEGLYWETSNYILNIGR